MELIEFYDLPPNEQKRFKKEWLNKVSKLFNDMGIELTQKHEREQWDCVLKETFFFEVPGNVYFQFKPKKI